MKKYVLVFLLILVVVMGRGCGSKETNNTSGEYKKVEMIM